MTAAGFTHYVKAPMPNYQGGEPGAFSSGDVLGVWCNLGDEVVWHWSNDDRVTGYTIRSARGVTV